MATLSVFALNYELNEFGSVCAFMSLKSPQLFLSYSSNDRPTAERLVAQLGAEGFDVWIDQSGIAPAANWSHAIAEALDGCSVFLLLLSQSSLASKNVIKELSLAAESDKHIIPIEMEPMIALPTAFRYHLAGIQRIGFQNVEAIVRALKTKLHDIPSTVSSNGAAIESASSRDSIRLAVLPFEDQSSTNDNGWFADGMTDELIGSLGSLSGIHVSPRGDVACYKSARPKLGDIAAELGCRFLIEGSVQKAGDKIRIRVSLSDAVLHRQIWSEKYSGTFEDVFELQEQTATQIASALELRLAPQEEQQLNRTETSNAAAYEYYLRGVEAVRRHTRTDYERAMRLFREATTLDPTFALAWLDLAEVELAYHRRYAREERWLAQAESDLACAVKHESESPRVLRLRSLIQLGRGNPEAALPLIERAVREDPQSSINFETLAIVYRTLGKRPEAIEARRKQAELAPNDLNAQFIYLTFIREDVLNSEEEMQKQSELSRKLLPVFERYIRYVPDDLNARTQYACVLGMSGDSDGAIREANALEASPTIDGIALASLAALYMNINDHAGALRAMRSAMERGYLNIDTFRIGKVYDPLRDKPEFLSLLDEMQAKIDAHRSKD